MVYGTFHAKHLVVVQVKVPHRGEPWTGNAFAAATVYRRAEQQPGRSWPAARLDLRRDFAALTATYLDQPSAAGPFSTPTARLDILEPAVDARRYVGENTDIGSDVTTQLQAWLTALEGNAGDHQREAFLPAGTYNVSAPILAPDGCKLSGQGSSGGGKNMMASRIKAMPGFVGDSILKSKNAGAGTSAVSSWHWGGIERIWCATRRAAISPVQPGQTRREVCGSDGLPGYRKVMGTRACQKTGDRAQVLGTVRREDPRDMAKA
ncbi:hypothetical protein [Pseudarthrobacter sp. H2]|uniref:hypothetical protein n=1 Tax=Pseudarthrobacter sp. H2 TaxID=3418415 RepID=UPI003CF469AB